MNYGKTAYLKVLDLEKRFSISKTENEFSSYLELSKNVAGDFNSTSPITIDFPKFKVGKSICFQIKPTLLLTASAKIKFELFVDDLLILEETKSLNKDESEFLVMKTYEPLSDEIAVKIRLSSIGQDNITLQKINFIVLGAESSSSSIDIELRAIKTDDDHALVSYIDDNKLYYTTTSLNEKSLSQDDFTLHSPALSHCIIKSSQREDARTILYKVDLSNNLYCYDFPSQSGQKIASDVVVVFACACPSTFDDDNIVVYIKTDGECYYRSMRGLVFTNERHLNIARGPYIDIRVISGKDVYIIASHSNGSNYIIKSLVEISTGKIIEKLMANYSVRLSKYIDLSFAKDNTIENLTALIKFDVDPKYFYNEAIERLSQTHLKLNPTLSCKKYRIVSPINYEVIIDPNQYDYPLQWASYGGDCKDFEPAVMDPETHILTDNGWLDRWPFDEIRPCLIKNGEVVGYLDKNDYSLFEDGSPSHIDDRNSGNVMVELPKMFFKISKDENDFAHFNLSNEYHDGYASGFIYKGKEYEKCYMATYLCMSSKCAKEGFYSYSGMTVATSTNTTFEQACNYLRQFNEPNYELLNYNLMTTLYIMYLVLFRTTNSIDYYYQANSSRYIATTTGKLDKAGMYYGTRNSTEGNKIFGMEDLFGMRSTYVAGQYLHSDGRIRACDPYDPNMSYDYKDIGTFKVVEGDYQISTDGANVGAIIINGTNETGLYPIKDKMGYATTRFKQGFCNSTIARLGAECMEFGQSATSAQYSSIFSSHYNSAKNREYYYNIRLVYYPLNTGD